MTEEIFEKLTELIEDENRIITYKWLAIYKEIHVNSAKSLLAEFISHQKNNKKEIKVVYCIGGHVRNATNQIIYLIKLVNDENLEKISKTFLDIQSQHVYSIQKGITNNITAVHVSDFQTNFNELLILLKSSSIVNNTISKRVFKTPDSSANISFIKKDSLINQNSILQEKSLQILKPYTKDLNSTKLVIDNAKINKPIKTLERKQDSIKESIDLKNSQVKNTETSKKLEKKQNIAFMFAKSQKVCDEKKQQQDNKPQEPKIGGNNTLTKVLISIPIKIQYSKKENFDKINGANKNKNILEKEIVPESLSKNRKRIFVVSSSEEESDCESNNLDENNIIGERYEVNDCINVQKKSSEKPLMNFIGNNTEIYDNEISEEELCKEEFTQLKSDINVKNVIKNDKHTNISTNLKKITKPDITFDSKNELCDFKENYSENIDKIKSQEMKSNLALKSEVNKEKTKKLPKNQLKATHLQELANHDSNNLKLKNNNTKNKNKATDDNDNSSKNFDYNSNNNFASITNKNNKNHLEENKMGLISKNTSKVDSSFSSIKKVLDRTTYIDDDGFMMTETKWTNVKKNNQEENKINSQQTDDNKNNANINRKNVAPQKENKYQDSLKLKSSLNADNESNDVIDIYNEINKQEKKKGQKNNKISKNNQSISGKQSTLNNFFMKK